MYLTLVTTLQVHYDSTITGFGHQIAYGSGHSHSRSDVGQNISGVTENAILWTPLVITFVQTDMVGP